MKKDIIAAVNYAKYFAFVLATICVLIFQFTTKYICINLALSLYVVAFGLMSASLISHASELYDVLKLIKKQNLEKKQGEVNQEGTMIVSSPSELKGEEVEPVNVKSEMTWAIIGSIFFGLFTIFSFILKYFLVIKNT